MKTEIDVLEKRTRSVDVCDDCGREVDDDGVLGHSCDFCSVCAPAYVDQEEPDEVMTVEQWTDSTLVDSNSFSPRKNFDEIQWWGAVLTAAPIVTLLEAAIVYESTLLGIVTVAMVYPAICLYGCLQDFRKQYVAAVGVDRR